MHPLDFTTQELLQAFAWGMDETTAGRYAAALAGDNESAGGEGYSSFNEEFLVVVSLVSDSARIKAEKRVAEIHGGHLTAGEQLEWERKRAEMREVLVRAGKIKD